MTRALGILGLAMPLAIMGVWLHFFLPTTAWAGVIPWVVSGVLVAAAVGTAWAALVHKPRVGLGIAAGLLGAQTLIVVAAMVGIRLIALDMYPDHRVAGVVAGLLVISVVGLARRRAWGRWLGLALGAVGAATGGLNAIKYWSVTGAVHPEYVAWSMEMFLTAWALWVSAFGGALVVMNLSSPQVREACGGHAAVWGVDHRLVHALRATVIASFAAVPMLLVYAWRQPIVPGTRDSAVALAVALTLAGVLAVRGKSLGALLLVVAGLGLLVQTAITWLQAPLVQREVATYYALFWSPAALLAVVCGVCLVAPMRRLLRR